MKGKYLKRVKKRILISTLTMLCICSQLGNTTVMAMSNRDITGLINDIGHEVSIVVDEDIVQEQESETASKSKEQAKPKVTTKKANKKGTYSSDKRIYYGKYTGTPYATTKAVIEQNPALQKDMEDYFGYYGLHPIYKFSNHWNDDLWTAYTHSDNSLVRKAMNSKTMRLELGDIAVKNGLVNRNNTTASAHIALFSYFGIINDADGLVEYKNTTKDYLSRQQAAVILFKYMHPNSYMDNQIDAEDISYTEKTLGEKNKYEPFVEKYEQSMLLGYGDSGFTKKEIESSMSRLEFIYLVVNTYFRDFLDEARQSKKTSADYFTDINKKDIITDVDKLYINNGWYDKEAKKLGLEMLAPGANNKAYRYCLKNKKLLSEYDAALEVAYKLGMLKPDSKGRSNLWKNITMSQALRMLIDATEGSMELRKK